MTSPKRPRRKKAGSPVQLSAVIKLIVVLGLAALGVHGGGQLLEEASCFQGDIDPFSKPLWVSQRCDIDR